jgi:hypothetical protein
MYSAEAMFSRAWWRILAPYLVLSSLVTAGAGIGYSHGAPIWTVYLGGLLAVLVALPGHERWENRQPRA